MTLYRCAACGSPNVMTDTQADGVGYNYVKGAVGTVILGTGGAAAGIESKNKRVFKCPDCGITLTYPMPQEIRDIIDLGVMSVDARDHLVLRNIPISWKTLTSSYKNIESGIGDQIAAEREEAKARKAKNQMDLLKMKGKATQEEFDSAVDEIISFRYRMGYYANRFEIPEDVYTTKNLPTLADFLVFKNALDVFIENYFRYLEITTDSSIKYRGLELYQLDSFVGYYLYAKFYEKYNEFLTDGNLAGEKGNVVKLAEFILNNPFYRELVKITWNMSYRSEKDVSKLINEGKSEFGFSVYLDYIAFAPLIQLFDGVLIPKILIKDGSLQYTSFTFLDSPLYCDTKKVKEEYFRAFPEAKKQWDNLYNDFKKREMKRKQQTDQIRNLENEVKSYKDLNSKDAAQIAMLEKKIFGKKKAAEEISDLKKAILSREDKIAKLLKSIQELKDSLPAEESEKEFMAKVDKEFGYYIIWHQVDESVK